MRDFLKIARGLFVGPWLYVYSLVSIIGTVASHRNTGLNGSPLLGATSIASSIACTCLFYWQLARLRKRSWTGKVSGLGLFFSISAFRVRILFLASPLLVLFYFLDYFSRISDAYLQVAIANPSQKFALYMQLVASVWPLALSYLAATLIDYAGRSLILAKGDSNHALRQTGRVILALWRPLLAIVAAAVAFYMMEEYLSSFDQARPWDIAATPRLIFDCAASPISYAFEMGTYLYIAQLVRERLAGLLGPNS